MSALISRFGFFVLFPNHSVRSRGCCSPLTCILMRLLVLFRSAAHANPGLPALPMPARNRTNSKLPTGKTIPPLWHLDCKAPQASAHGTAGVWSLTRIRLDCEEVENTTSVFYSCSEWIQTSAKLTGTVVSICIPGVNTVVESKNITTVLIDDHKMFRQGIQLLLEREGIGIVGHAENGHEGLSLVEQLRPNLALLDVNLPLLNGIELASMLRKECPSTGLIMLTAYRNHDYVVRTLRAGAMGYVWKGADFAELVIAINAVSQGQRFISPAVSNEILSGYLKNENRLSGKVDVLTPRQRQVLQLIAEGRTSKEIATLLSLSVKGVEKHRSDLMRRLDLHNIAELVRYAVQSGIPQAA